MSHVMFALICLIWGTAFILMSKATAVFGPLTIGAWRSTCGAVALALLWYPVRKSQPWPLRRADFRPLLLVAALCYAVPYVLQPLVIPRIGSALMGMMMALVPLLTVAVSVPMLKVYPRPRQMLGVLGGLALMTLLLAGAWRHGAAGFDLLLAASVPMGYAIAYTFVKRRFSKVPPLPLACISVAMAAVPLLPLSLACEHVNRNSPWTGAVVSLALLGIFCTGLAAYMYYKLVQAHGPLHAGMAMYIVPLVATIWGSMAGESITLTQVLLLLGVLAMVALVQWQPRGAPAQDVEPVLPE